jgi:hypothetical protein
MYRKDPTQSERSESTTPTEGLRSEVEHPTPSFPSGLTPEVRGQRSDLMPEPWIPESKLTKLPPRYAKYPFISFVRNILLRTPLFPKFYADVVLDSVPNSKEAKSLRPQYQKLLQQVNQVAQKVHDMAQTKTCTHIKVTGVRCGSPALTGEQFCYFHQSAHRGVRKPPQSRLHPIAMIEDEESIQASLMEVINALMRNTIDLKRAELILRALHIAVKNARRAKFEVHKYDMVRDIPEYAEPPVDRYAPKNFTNDEILALRAQMLADYEREQAAKTSAHVGTAAPSCPSGPEVSVRSNGSAKPAPPIPAHNFKQSPQPTRPERTEDKQNNREVNDAEQSEGTKVPEARPKLAQRFSARNAAPTKQPRAVGTPEPPTQTQTPLRKPSASVNQAPKERKNTAQCASAG